MHVASVSTSGLDGPRSEFPYTSKLHLMCNPFRHEFARSTHARTLRLQLSIYIWQLDDFVSTAIPLLFELLRSLVSENHSLIVSLTRSSATGHWMSIINHLLNSLTHSQYTSLNSGTSNTRYQPTNCLNDLLVYPIYILGQDRQVDLYVVIFNFSQFSFSHFKGALLRNCKV